MAVCTRLQKSLIFCAIVSTSAWSVESSTGFPTPNSDDIFEISLDQLSQLVITGATMHEETLRSVPATVTVYTKEQIRQLGVTRLTELMNYVPGFQSQRNDHSAISHAYSARGGRFDGSGREILVLLDGQRLNSDWAGGLVSSYGMIDLYSADRIEFIRGPGSPLYGSNAYLGVVNITTKASNELHVAVGKNNHYESSAQYRHQFDQGQVELFLKTLDDGGQDLTVYDPFVADSIESNDAHQLQNIHLKAQFSNTSFMYHKNDTVSDDFYVVGVPFNGLNTFSGVTEFGRLDHAFQLPNKWKANASLSLSRSEFHLKTVVSPAPIYIEGTVKEREPKAEVIFTKALSSGEKTVLGFEWRNPEIMNSDAYFTGAAEAYLPQAPLTSRTIKGAFFQYQNNLSENMHYLLGMRIDDYSNFGDHAVPRAGLVWNYSTDNTLKFLYGESFRAPSRSETDVINSGALKANPNLEPEIAKTSEIVWLHQPSGYTISATLFHTQLKDVIVRLAALPGVPAERENSGNEHLSGVELEYSHDWNQNLSSRMNATWLVESVKGASSEANAFAGVSLVYQYEKIQSSLMLNYHASKQDADASLSEYRDVPSRVFVDLNVRWQIGRNLEWHTHISNALGQDYNSVASTQSSNVTGVENRGVDFITGMRFTF